MKNGPRQTLKHKLSRLGLPAQSLFVAAALGLVYLGVSPLAYGVSGVVGLQVALLAAVICWFGALFSLAISAMLRSSVAVMHRMLMGMAARAMVPMVLGVGLHVKDPGLAAAGLIFYVIVFYMVALAADTALLVAQVPEPLVPSKVAGGFSQRPG